jgi:hypothetical protein
MLMGSLVLGLEDIFWMKAHFDNSIFSDWMLFSSFFAFILAAKRVKIVNDKPQACKFILQLLFVFLLLFF